MNSLRKLPLQAKLAWFATAFAFCVVMFGAFVRLSNAGLSCPDWPTCYGQAAWPTHAHEIARADKAFPQRPVETHKAWREQFHRMIAGTLGVLVLALALLAAWNRPWARWLLAAAAVSAAAAVALYIGGDRLASAILGAIALVLPLGVAAGLQRPAPWRLAVMVLAVIIFQAMLGMWTVTLLVAPIVVMSHLMGGIATFALLAYIALRIGRVGAEDDRFRVLRRWIALGIVLLVLQIALGGWTGSNYAALSCGFGDAAFPKCQGQWWPTMDFGQGFVLWREIGVNYEGGILDGPARTAIQMAHRIGALVVAAYLPWLAWRVARAGLKALALSIVTALVVQVALGISNVHFGLPLWVATLHNGVAAVLLFTLLATLARTQRRLAVG